MTRFWIWQVWRRIGKRPLVILRADGAKLRLPPWSHLAGLTIATGLHEPREQLFVQSFIRPGDHTIDVGANIGIYTTLLGLRGAQITAFEPGSRSRDDLQRTLELNPSVKATVVPAAASDQPGELRLTLSLESSNYLVSGEGNMPLPSELVTVVRIDDLVVTGQIPTPVHFIKIDAEGFDINVLRGAEETINRDSPVMLVEIWKDDPVVAWLYDHGYQIYKYLYQECRLARFPPNWTRPGTVIAVHESRLEDVEARLSGSAYRNPPRLPRFVGLAR